MAKPSSHDPEIGLGATGDDQPSEVQPLLANSANSETDAGDLEVTEEGGTDIIQFSAPIYYADEEEPMMKIDILRLGSMTGRVAVNYYTANASAQSSVNYGSISGRLVFDDSEHTRTIQVPILDDGKWGPTAEFAVHLVQPRNCTLGLYLHTSRVKILNSQCFPTDLYAEYLEKGQDAVHDISAWGLFREYCRLNLQNSAIGCRTAITLVLDQLSNVLLFISLVVEVYIVDTLFARGGSKPGTLLLGDQYRTACVIAAWFVLVVILLHIITAIKVHIDIRGKSREFLVMALAKTYLDYTKQSRAEVQPSRVLSVIETGAGQIADGFDAVLSMIGAIGKLMAIGLFIFAFQPEPFAVGCIAASFLGLCGFVLLRTKYVQQAQEDLEAKEETVKVMADEMCNKFQLISDYTKRPMVIDMLAKAVAAQTMAKIPDSVVKLNNKFVANFVSCFVLAVYFIAKTPDVINNRLSLGIFLAMITIFTTQLTEAIVELNRELGVIIDSLSPLKDLTICLNMPLELQSLKRINRMRRSSAIEERSKVLSPGSLAQFGARAEHEGTKFKSDLIKLRVRNLSFGYIPGMNVLENVSLEITQGHMVAVTGPHKSGKTTFMELLMNMLPAEPGSIFVPSYLRILPVSLEPMFLRTSMLTNLCLGLPYHGAIDLHRVCKILDSCGLEEFIEVVEADARKQLGSDKLDEANLKKLKNEDVQFIASTRDLWDKQITQSQKIRLHIARALISNSEVLIVQRTLQGLSDDAATHMLGVLRQHVQEKGLWLPEEGRTARRPRTVFFSTESEMQIAFADHVLQLEPTAKTIISVRNHTPRTTDAHITTKMARRVSPFDTYAF